VPYFIIGTCTKKIYLCKVIIKEEILNHRSDFIVLCQKHHVKQLLAFGSSTTDDFNYNTSDIDLLVEIDDADPIERGENLMSLCGILLKCFFIGK